MQIKINLQIFLFIIIFVLTHQIEIYSWIMLFAFIHELGHMMAGILLKLEPKALAIMPFGISITFETYGYKKLIEIKKIILALARTINKLYNSNDSKRIKYKYGDKANYNLFKYIDRNF